VDDVGAVAQGGRALRGLSDLICIDLTFCHRLRDEGLHPLLDIPSLKKIEILLDKIRKGEPSPVYDQLAERDVDIWRPDTELAQKIGELRAQRLRASQPDAG